MKRIFKYSYIALFALMGLAFNACTDKYDYDPVEEVDNSGAYVLATGKTTLYYNDTEEQTFNIKVCRHDDTEAKTYNLTVNNENVTVAKTVSFAAGETEKELKVVCHLQPGDLNQRIIIGVADGNAYMYGAHSQTYNISCCKTFTATFGSSAFGDDEGNLAQWPVTVYQMGVTTNSATGKKTATYMIDDVYGDDYGVIFTLQENGKAATESQPAWKHQTYGDVYVSGNGTYFEAYNAILFSWSMDVSLGGFGVFSEYLFFPGNYDPFNQQTIE